MKTPDEIKRGLENCGTSLPCRDDCPYHALCWQHHDVRAVDRDALAYIQQLERERDAAMEQMHGACRACKHLLSAVKEGPCASCMYNNGELDGWEWCGVEEDEE